MSKKQLPNKILPITYVPTNHFKRNGMKAETTWISHGTWRGAYALDLLRLEENRPSLKTTSFEQTHLTSKSSYATTMPMERTNTTIVSFEKIGFDPKKPTLDIPHEKGGLELKRAGL